MTPDDEVAKINPGDGSLVAEPPICKANGSPLRNPEAPIDAAFAVVQRVGEGIVAAGAGVNRFILTRMGGPEGP